MSEIYKKLREEVVARGDANSCSVVAVAVVCNVSYETAAAAMERVGRRHGEGAYPYRIHEAIESLGYRVIYAPVNMFTRKTAELYNYHVQRPTTKHPQKFPKVWKDGRSYLVYTVGHVSAVVDGVCHDWAAGKAKRIKKIMMVVPA